MSLSLRDELRIVLHRDQLQLVRVGRHLTVRGIRPRILEKKTLSCEAGEGAVWEGALKTLESALAALPRKPAYAQVVLSSQFLNYGMVKLETGLQGEAEELAFARHQLAQVYGAAANSWELRLSQDFSGGPLLACGMDAALLQQLRGVFERTAIKLKSVQPQLMAAFNNCRSQMQGQDVWFVLYEHGSLSIGLVAQGQWRSVRSFSVGEDWYGKLQQILDREAYLSEIEFASDRVFLWAPEFIKTGLPKLGQWKVHKLRPEIRASFAADFDERYALAICG